MVLTPSVAGQDFNDVVLETIEVHRMSDFTEEEFDGGAPKGTARRARPGGAAPGAQGTGAGKANGAGRAQRRTGRAPATGADGIRRRSGSAARARRRGLSRHRRRGRCARSHHRPRPIRWRCCCSS